MDIADASGGRFPSNPDQALACLTDIHTWYRSTGPIPDDEHTIDTLASDPSPLGPPVTNPGQIFAVGLNYADHSQETGLTVPDEPLIFTKFASSIAGPAHAIPLPTETCDWEVELVVVIGSPGRDIAAENAARHIAGFCVGQDISERKAQMAGSPAQFSLAKSHQAFTPIGPWITTLDELATPYDLAITASIDGETVQSARTSDMIFDIPTLISHLSKVCELRTGDLIFTGTPAGVGYSRNPARYLRPGNLLTSKIEGLGVLRNAVTVAQNSWSAVQCTS
ncbi:fumarylacetoacetate hydrolase family protein [Nocardia sp. CA-135398]|uniref:fumarylacetoacetate hydrolase family protein n=1 Tax=Nocardia sp. CA-135398 TaxID=3239977 RepID=UPI003D95BE4E